MIQSFIAALLSLAAATPGATGSISGTVTDRATGARIPGGCVFLYKGESTAPFVDPSTKTADDGTYSFTGLPAGTAYRVEFAPYSPFFGDYIPANACFSSGNFFTAWYKDAEGSDDATRVTVTDGAATTGIDQQLDPAASISGRVTDARGKPVARACVTLNGGGRIPTGTDGTYEFQYLGPGTFRLKFGLRGQFLAAPALVPCAGGYGVVKRSVTVSAAQQVTDADIVLRGLPRPGLSAEALCKPIKGDSVRCRVRGRLRPSGGESGKTCSGPVTITYAVGRESLVSDGAIVTRRCRYHSTFVLAVDRAERARLAVHVRYQGNAYNGVGSAKPQRKVFPID